MANIMEHECKYILCAECIGSLKSIFGMFRLFDKLEYLKTWIRLSNDTNRPFKPDTCMDA